MSLPPGGRFANTIAGTGLDRHGRQDRDGGAASCSIRPTCYLFRATNYAGRHVTVKAKSGSDIYYVARVKVTGLVKAH